MKRPISRHVLVLSMGAHEIEVRDRSGKVLVRQHGKTLCEENETLGRWFTETLAAIQHENGRLPGGEP